MEDKKVTAEAAQLRLARRVGSCMTDKERVAYALAAAYQHMHPELTVRATGTVVRVEEAIEDPISMELDVAAEIAKRPVDPATPPALRGWIPLLTLKWLERAHRAMVLAFPPLCRRCKMPLRRQLRFRDPEHAHRECSRRQALGKQGEQALERNAQPVPRPSRVPAKAAEESEAFQAGAALAGEMIAEVREALAK